jgi:hypothetical protein
VCMEVILPHQLKAMVVETPAGSTRWTSVKGRMSIMIK